MSFSSSRLPARPSLEQLRKQAKDLLRACRAGDPAARQRLESANGHTTDRTAIKLADAQFALAREYGFETWAKLVDSIQKTPASPQPVTPLYKINWKGNTIEPESLPSDADWDAIFAVMQERGITGLHAKGKMSDAALQRLSKIDTVTRLNLDGSLELTGEGLTNLSRLSGLRELDLSGSKGRITDRDLHFLRDLPELRRFALCWQQNVTDAGVATLGRCEYLESVNLLGTPTGDGAIRALTGMRHLRQFKTGKGVTDEGLALWHLLPAFQTWQGGELNYALMSADAGPTHLLLDGPFTNAGLASLAGLDGLFGLSFFWHASQFTADGLRSLRDLPRLGFLGCGGDRCDDQAMQHIGAIPGLRMLMGQGAVATDRGFEALSRCPSLEYFWGRECPNLTGRGFSAMTAMPALRGLAVTCKNLDDRSLAALPRFPALREFMPMDVSDDGFRHIGQCEHLEALWCMYCRETGDAATEHIAGLSRLKTYYAGKTQITDRSLEVLGRMPSLEHLEFWQCAGITNAGIAHLAGLPKLRELNMNGLAGVTRQAISLFPEHVQVSYSP